MKVPISWLKEYISTELSAEEIASTLTLAGLEVEAIVDDILEISLTPNLAHCASIRGVARELSALTENPIHSPKFELAEKRDESISQVTSVVVKQVHGCPRYACRLIRNVKVAPSPDWLKKRIESCGIRSVNNVVDITNYVLLEWDHPLHAFDFDRLEGGRLVIRLAENGEKLTTLDGKEHFLTEKDLVIGDAKKAVALAGIMGSLSTEVTDQTRTVLLESAYFEPSQIRHTCQRLGIHSEASYRFERGTDPNDVVSALERASAFLCDVAGGEVLRELIDHYPHPVEKPMITCRLNRVNRLLGTHLAMSEIETIFRRLGFAPSEIHDDQISVHIPTYRHDIRQEIDLIEEIARLYGYGNLRKDEPSLFRVGALGHSEEYLLAREVRSRLIAEGLQELLTCDLISPQQAALISPDNFPARTLINLLNPHSIDQSIMRPSMLPGMLSAIKYNAHYSIHSVSGFELGRVHFTSKDRYYEPSAVAIVLTGENAFPYWGEAGKLVDFFDLKGIVENLLQGLKIPSFHFIPSRYVNFHPHRQAKILIDQVEIGIMGEIHPHTLRQADLEHKVYFAEINLSDLQHHIKTTIKMKPLPHYPASLRDWTITLQEAVPVGNLLEQMNQGEFPLLESASLINLYRSDKLGAGLKNATFRFVYRSPIKTISLAEVENEHGRIVEKITSLIDSI